MKINKLLYLDLKGQKNFSLNLYKNYIIQKNNVRCEDYAIGFNADISLMEDRDKKNNSIYGTGYLSTTLHSQILSFELTGEVSKYGEKIFKVCKKYFKLYNIKIPIINDNIILSSINENTSNKILNIFCDWCKNYGFPIEPQKHSFNDDEVHYFELTFEEIKKLTVQFIIIYLLNTFYEDLHFIFTRNSEEYYLEENQMFKIKRINRALKLFDIRIKKIDEDFFYKSTTEKTNIKNIILESLIIPLNEYAPYFNNSSEKYFSYLEGKIYYQNVFTNIFDICWNHITQNYISLTTPTRECAICHQIIAATTNKKYCDECAKKRNRSKDCHNNKILLMQKIINYYMDNCDYITDDKVKINEISTIEKYNFIVSKKRGFSKKLENTTRTELEKYYKHLKQLIFKYTQI